MSDTEVKLKAALDAGGIKKDVAKIQKTLDKQTVSLPAEIDAKKLIKSVKAAVPKVIKELEKIPEIDVPVNTVINQKSVNTLQTYKKVISDISALQDTQNAVENKALETSLEQVSNVWSRFQNGFSIGGMVEFGLNEMLQRFSNEGKKLNISDIVGIGAGAGMVGLSAFVKNFA